MNTHQLRNILLAGIFGAVALFVWNAFSWMVLPWHAKNLQQFSNETLVSGVIKNNVKKSGVYLSGYNNPSLDGSPLVFSVVSFYSKEGMQSQLITYFLIELVTALIVASVIGSIKCANYFGRLIFIILFALAAAISCQLPYWNWWHFPLNYIMVSMLDMLIGWFLAGILMAAILAPRNILNITTDKITIHRE